MPVVHVMPTWEEHHETLNCWCCPTPTDPETKATVPIVEAEMRVSLKEPLVIVHHASEPQSPARFL